MTLGTKSKLLVRNSRSTSVSGGFRPDLQCQKLVNQLKHLKKFMKVRSEAMRDILPRATSSDLAAQIPVRSRNGEMILPSPISFLLLPNFTSIALFSVVEALRVANRYLSQKYQWCLTSLDGQPVPDSNGILVSVFAPYNELSGAPRTVILAGGDNPEQSASRELVAELKWLSRKGVKLGGLDTGQQVLAKIGLLKGYRATVHWENAPAFQEHYPTVELTSNLFEFDGNRMTCAGGTAGIDMILYAVECDHGREYAVRISEHFMHERIRRGSEPQRKNISHRFGVHHPKIVQAIKLMEERVEDPLGMAELATETGLSSRQLSRLFKDLLKMSPHQFYLDLRLARARQMLIHTEMNVIDVALACGFQTQSHFSRVYRERFGFPPSGARHPVRGRTFLVLDVPASEDQSETT